jgi:hypothetical protein
MQNIFSSIMAATGRQLKQSVKVFQISNRSLLTLTSNRSLLTLTHTCEGLPDLDVVPPLALVVEAIDAVDRGALVITAQDEKVLWKFDFERQQQANCFQGLLPPILSTIRDIDFVYFFILF